MRPFNYCWLLVLSLATWLPVLSHAGQTDKTLDIYWVDVEGGGATLLVTPTGESVLIDSGNPGGRDAGRIHQTATQVAGLARIDHYVTTHFHVDHFGGAAELAARMPIGQVYDNGPPDTDPDGGRDTRWPLMSKPYREFKADRRNVLTPGQTIPLRQPDGQPKLSLRCLAAKQKFVEAKSSTPQGAHCDKSAPKDKDTSDNANSIAVVLEFGGFRFFDGGDMTWNTEGELVCPQNRVGSVDVYQVNHHGLDVSNNPLLVYSLAPTISVMNNGPRKGTAKATVDTLKSSPGIQAMYQLHKNVRPGEDSNTSDECIANLPEKCEANYLKLSVAPSGQSYTMRIPATSYQKTFQSKARQ
jgi:competence protein ComEC